MHPILIELLEDVIRGEVVESAIGHDGSEYKGWYCININPCVCVTCGRPVCYVEPDMFHVIIVWEEKDNEYLLKIAQRIKELGLDPRIETYYPLLGNCITWEEVLALDESE